MKIRYLYGKSKYLDPIIKGSAGIRFSDLSHYSRLENEKMRDNEMKKNFIVRKDSDFILEINGVRISNKDISGDILFTAEPRHCYCLCLTSKKDDLGLYRDFEADTCIAFNVDQLEERITLVCEKFSPSYIRGQDITYYDQYTMNAITNSPEELVFYKPDIFSHEAEYRIAWFYPLHKTGFLVEGRSIPFRTEGESSHLVFFHENHSFVNDCIVDIYRKPPSDLLNKGDKI